ncbi:hypothetical protein J6X04_03170 [Candidatus Saccharibacteria bacterium]|nr:hypothetical protein [Candidatus Saccharibacteria bacterium]
MKTDLATSIGLAIVGVIVAYFICDILVGNWFTGNYSIKTLETSVSSDVAEPDVEVFNYNALNPTVEVYVGDECQDSDEECIDGNTEDNGQNPVDNIGDE